MAWNNQWTLCLNTRLVERLRHDVACTSVLHTCSILSNATLWTEVMVMCTFSTPTQPIICASASHYLTSARWRNCGSGRHACSNNITHKLAGQITSPRQWSGRIVLIWQLQGLGHCYEACASSHFQIVCKRLARDWHRTYLHNCRAKRLGKFNLLQSAKKRYRFGLSTQIGISF